MHARFQPLFSLIRQLSIPWILLIPACLISLVETGAALWAPMLTRDLVDSSGSGTLDRGTLLTLVFVLVTQAALSGVSLYLLSRAGEHVTAFIREALFDRLVHLPLSFHDNAESGELVSRTISDTASVQTLLTQQAVAFISGLVSVVGATAILWFLDWRLTLVLFSSVCVGLLTVLPVASSLQAVGREIQDQQAKFSGRLTSILGEIRLLKAFCAEDRERQRAASSIHGLRKLGLREARTMAILGPTVTLSITGALVVILSYGGSRVSSGALAVGTLVAFILYLFQVALPMVQFSTFFAALGKAAGAAEHLSALLATDKGRSGDQWFSTPRAGYPALRFVDFSYESERPILKRFNLEIPVGKVTALVGPSGSGKTTVLGLLERFYAPDGGNIYYGGHPIESFPLELWRRRIGYVPQEAPLISGTVRENLCWGLAEEPTPQKIERVLRAARADRFVGNLEQGLDTFVGERGVKLSGGQRQRLAIARAFLADPGILMLDEATANLDAESEESVHLALANLMQGRTTLIITHRLSTVIEADQIAVVVDGSVSGLGTHQQLLESNVLYSELVDRQLMGDRAAG